MSFRPGLLTGVVAFVAFAVAGCGDGSAGPGPVDSDAPTEFTQTPSGLKYRILRKSNGAKPSATSLIKAHYRGWLDDGTEFDSSYKKGKGPLVTPLGGVIPAWTEGLQLIGQGGMIELEVPPNLGYGERGYPPRIPGNATLHFIIELDSVRNAL